MEPTHTNDTSIAAASYRDGVNPDGTKIGGGTPSRMVSFSNTHVPEGPSNVNFHYCSKRIKFDRPAWLADYTVDASLINCLAQNTAGGAYTHNDVGSYFGCWVEKGFDEFTIYVAFCADTNVPYAANNQSARFPAPHSLTYTTSGKKKKTTTTINVSQRDGGRFSGFVVPVSDILYSNTEPISTTSGKGYVGNPRIGKCTYPTVIVTGKH